MPSSEAGRGPLIWGIVAISETDETTMKDYYFEDFELGQKFESEKVTLSEEEIISFGEKFAPLPYHTDPVGAKETAYGGVIATGYHTAAITFGLFVRTGVLGVAAMGSPGVDKLRWLKPVRPNDELHVVAEVVEVSPARGERGRDAVRIRYDTINQHGDIVMSLTSLHFLKRRAGADA